MRKLTAPKYFLEKHKESMDYLITALETANIDQMVVKGLRDNPTIKRLWFASEELARADRELVPQKRYLVNAYLDLGQASIREAWATLQINNPSLWNQGSLHFIPDEEKIVIRPSVQSLISDMGKKFKEVFGVGMEGE